MPEDIVFAKYDSAHDGALPQIYQDLFAAQRHSWPLFAQGEAALHAIEHRTLACRGFSVQLQHNPGRIASSGARVDAGSIAGRRCFLCEQNRPAGQKAILYKGVFQLLVNPMPIFHHHGTIVHNRHTAQSIEGSLPWMFDLAKDLSPAFTLFYNGPACGASAPDHFHFQSSPCGLIPLEHESRDSRYLEKISDAGDVTLRAMKNYGRSVLVYEGGDVSSLQRSLQCLFAVLRRVLATDHEPPVNIICSYAQGLWRTIVILRGRHRPEAYFKEGDDRLLISPASVDMGGLVIVPVRRDFDRISAEMIENIFLEVSLSRDHFERIIEQIRRS